VDLQKRREAVSRQVRLLEAQLKVHKAELEAIDAEWRRRMAVEEVRADFRTIDDPPVVFSAYDLPPEQFRELVDLA
jgi:hypothetical protein